MLNEVLEICDIVTRYVYISGTKPAASSTDCSQSAGSSVFIHEFHGANRSHAINVTKEVNKKGRHRPSSESVFDFTPPK